MSKRPFPAPVPGPISRGFWDAASDGRLVVQTCDACGHVQYPPMGTCQRCFSKALAFRPASGRGTIYITSAVWRPQVADAPVPYIVAIADMEEGWRLMCNLVGYEGTNVPVGMPVRVVFEEAGDDGLKVPAFVKA